MKTKTEFTIDVWEVFKVMFMATLGVIVAIELMSALLLLMFCISVGKL